jgi:hypothetical protein
MMQSLEAIDYSDQKVLSQFMSVSSFLGLTDLRAGPVAKFGACAIGRREYALGLEAIQNAVAFDLSQRGSWTGDRERLPVHRDAVRARRPRHRVEQRRGHV